MKGLIDKLRGQAPPDPELQAEALSGDTQQQLVELFNKRNELKRAYDRVTAERDELMAELGMLRKSHAEMSRKLDSLEKALVNPLVAPSVLVYYALEKVWNTCRQYMADAAQELRARYEEEEKGVLMQQYRKRQEQEQRAVQQELDALAAEREERLARRRELEQALARAGQLWHFFKRKKLKAELAGLRAELAPLDERHRELLGKLEEIRDREPPRYSGMSRAAMRIVNLHLIAQAQYFYIRLAGEDISSRAHDIRDKLPHEVNFGGPGACLDLQKKIHAVLAALIEDPDRAGQIRGRVQTLKSSIRYASDKDVVPDPDSLKSIELSSRESDAHELGNTLIANVLELDSWELSRYLVRP